MPEQANTKHKKALSLLTAQIKHDLMFRYRSAATGYEEFVCVQTSVYLWLTVPKIHDVFRRYILVS